MSYVFFMHAKESLIWVILAKTERKAERITLQDPNLLQFQEKIDLFSVEFIS